MLRATGRLPLVSGERDRVVPVTLSPETEDLFLNDLQHIIEDIEVSSRVNTAPVLAPVPVPVPVMGAQPPPPAAKLVVSEDEGSSFGGEVKRYTEKELHEIWGKSNSRCGGIPECIAVEWRQPPESYRVPMFGQNRQHHTAAAPPPAAANKRSELSPADQARLGRTIHLMGIDASQPRNALFDVVTNSGSRPMKMFRFCGEVNERRTTRFAFIEMETREDALECVASLHLKPFGANILQCAMAKNPIFQGITVGADNHETRVGGKQKMTKVSNGQKARMVAGNQGGGSRNREKRAPLFTSTSSVPSSGSLPSAESSPLSSPSGSAGRNAVPWASYSVRA